MTFSGIYRHHFGLLTLLCKMNLNAIVVQKILPLGVKRIIEQKKYNMMSLLLDAVVIFLGCATVAFSERYTVLFTACGIYKKKHSFHLPCNVTLN